MFRTRVFLSYRRGEADVGRLRDGLVRAFGERRVFRDIDSADEMDGRPFADVLSERLHKSDCCVVVIGPKWLSDLKRLQDPSDFVRMEIASALAAPKVKVVPVLIDGAAMPAPDSLPADIAPIAGIGAIPFNDLSWSNAMRRLIATARRSFPLIPGVAAAAILLAALWFGYPTVAALISLKDNAARNPENTAVAPTLPETTTPEPLEPVLVNTEPVEIRVRNMAAAVLTFRVAYTDRSGDRKWLESDKFLLNQSRVLAVPRDATKVELTIGVFILDESKNIFRALTPGKSHCTTVTGTFLKPSTKPC